MRRILMRLLLLLGYAIGIIWTLLSVMGIYLIRFTPVKGDTLLFFDTHSSNLLCGLLLTIGAFLALAIFEIGARSENKKRRE